MTDEIDALASLHTLADELAAFDCVEGPVPRGIDVPDDYEAGLHDAASRLRRVLTRLAPPDTAALVRVRKLAEGWVGFDESHHYGDAVLRALPTHVLPPAGGED